METRNDQQCGVMLSVPDSRPRSCVFNVTGSFSFVILAAYATDNMTATHNLWHTLATFRQMAPQSIVSRLNQYVFVQGSYGVIAAITSQ